jgi:hypothetical protein
LSDVDNDFDEDELDDDGEQVEEEEVDDEEMDQDGLNDVDEDDDDDGAVAAMAGKTLTKTPPKKCEMVVMPQGLAPQWKGIMTRSRASQLATATYRSTNIGDVDDAEKQKVFEGADALLNLASVGLLSLFNSARADHIMTSVADDEMADVKETLGTVTARNGDITACCDDIISNNNNNCISIKSIKQEMGFDISGMTNTSIKEEPMDDS